MSGKILEFRRRDQFQNSAKVHTNNEPLKPELPEPLDFLERRQAIIEQERRQVKRTILSEFIGAWVVVPEKGLQRCAIYDVSEKGMALDLDLNLGHFTQGQEVAVRVYLNQFTYFPIMVKVENSRIIEEEGVHRHGCTLNAGAANREALEHFVKFIETVSTYLKTDKGDIVVSHLREG